MAIGKRLIDWYCSIWTLKFYFIQSLPFCFLCKHFEVAVHIVYNPLLKGFKGGGGDAILGVLLPQPSARSDATALINLLIGWIWRRRSFLFRTFKMNQPITHILLKIHYTTFKEWLSLSVCVPQFFLFQLMSPFPILWQTIQASGSEIAAKLL